jgi:glycosidase
MSKRASAAASAPEWLHDAVFYQILPDRFANGDPSIDPPDVVPWDSKPTRTNFFGGDLKGIEQRLDHVVSLGANAIYLNPVFEADTNHRYDAKDYFSIDHRLGTLGDFRRFLAASHGQNVKVVLDGVFNHAGDGHPHFQDVVAQEARSDYVNWFSVADFPVAGDPEPNYRTFAGCWNLPKWNIFNPKVREHHLDVARHWLELGIDGWRLDVPWLVPSPFWSRFRETVKGIDEDAYIVAEEWREPEQWLQGDRCDGTMNYTMRALLLGFTADRTIDAFELAHGMNELRDRIPAGFRHGMLNLLGSHDTERVLTRHKRNWGRCLLGHALMFLSEGAPMVYYGDEIGLKGANDPGCRAAMPWDEARWDHRLLEGMRALAELRSATAALRRGSQEYVAVDPDTVMVVRDFQGQRTVGVAHRGSGTTLSPTVVPLGDPRVLLSRGAARNQLRRNGFVVLAGEPAPKSAVLRSL